MDDIRLNLLLPAGLLAALLDSISHGKDDVKAAPSPFPITWLCYTRQGPAVPLFAHWFALKGGKKNETKRKKKGKILMWDNPHVSYHITTCCCVFVIVAIDSRDNYSQRFEASLLSRKIQEDVQSA